MSQSDNAYCQQLVRETDRDRYVADLFAPAGPRPSLFALHAFNIEIGRVRDLVSEPMAGEIRLQWWHDVLHGAGRGEIEGNPVAATLLDVASRHDLPLDRLRELVDAHRNDLYSDPIATFDAFQDYARLTAATMFALAARVLAPGLPIAEEAIIAAGEAYTVASALHAMPRLAARGHIFFPGDMLARHAVERADVFAGRSSQPLRAAAAELAAYGRARLAAFRRAQVPEAFRPVFLPLALIDDDLIRVERSEDLFSVVMLAPWRRQWRLCRAMRRGL
jgi:phytoene synthase